MRKVFLAIIVLFVAATLLYVSLGRRAGISEEVEVNWSTFRGDFNRSGLYRDSLKLPLSFIRKIEVNGTMTCPCGYEDKVYVVAGMEVICFKDMQVLWNEGLLSTSFCPPTIYEGLLFLGGEDGVIRAYNGSSGELLWSVPTRFRVRTSPACWRGEAIFCTYEGSVFALNISNGNQLWGFSTDYHITASPLVYKGLAIISSQDHRIYCLNASTGALCWSLDLGYRVEHTPCLLGDVLFVPCGRSLQAIDLHGRKLWEYRATRGITCSPATNGERVIFCFEKKVACLNTSGKMLWSFEMDSRTTCAPIIVGDMVFICSGTGHLYCLSLEGELLWEDEVGVHPVQSLAVFNGLLLVPSEDGLLILGSGG
ncbi:MAG TPA: hypothetical protein ENF57_04005 [Candidatus Korarchaeota archaeon]|nr:hypothetical protein [Candidatus Korarchaeota archaeon]